MQFSCKGYATLSSGNVPMDGNNPPGHNSTGPIDGRTNSISMPGSWLFCYWPLAVPWSVVPLQNCSPELRRLNTELFQIHCLPDSWILTVSFYYTGITDIQDQGVFTELYGQ